MFPVIYGSGAVHILTVRGSMRLTCMLELSQPALVKIKVQAPSELNFSRLHTATSLPPPPASRNNHLAS
jgi:hypothetical protein